MFNKNQAIKRWVELEIQSASFTFSCGGDSMGDTELFLETKNGTINDKDLENYFMEEVYKEVEFYEVSDGHYMGESGTVEITYDTDSGDFEYIKTAKSEYNEPVSTTVDVLLSEEEIKFFSEYVTNIVGQNNFCETNFSKNFVLTEERQSILGNIEEKVLKAAEEADFTDFEGEQNDNEFSFSADEIDGDKLIITVETFLTIYTFD